MKKILIFTLLMFMSQLALSMSDINIITLLERPQDNLQELLDKNTPPNLATSIYVVYASMVGISLRKHIITMGMPIIRNDGDKFFLDLSNANLNNLDGLDKIPGIELVTHLDLSNNKLTKLPEGLLNKFCNLKNLNLSNNKISKFPEGIFNALINLESLNLSFNRFLILPNNIFDDLNNLKHLILDSNKLIKLPKLNSLCNLEILSLFNNRLVSLPKNIFTNLNNLQCLVLDSNLLSKLPDNIFNELYNLKTLNLSNNRFKLTTEEFRKQYLTNNNRLDILCLKTEAEKQLDSIQKQLIKHIKIKDIFGIYINLAELKVLKEENPLLRILYFQTDEDNKNILHLAVKFLHSNPTLIKKIFDTILIYLNYNTSLLKAAVKKNNSLLNQKLEKTTLWLTQTQKLKK